MGNVTSWLTQSLCPEEQVLWMAAKNGDHAVLRTAVSRLTAETRAYLEWKDPIYGYTPLANACENGHRESALVLLEVGADVNARDLKGNTPLLVATKNGKSELVQLLLELPMVDQCAKNTAGQTALDIARVEYKTEEGAHSFVRCMELIEKKLCIYSGWLYERAENLLSMASGISSLNSWKKRYCMVLRTSDVGVVEIDLFPMKPGERRPPCPSSELVFRVNEGLRLIEDNKWFNRKEFTFSLTAFAKVGINRISAPQSFDFAACSQEELRSWRAFFASLTVSDRSFHHASIDIIGPRPAPSAAPAPAAAPPHCRSQSFAPSAAHHVVAYPTAGAVARASTVSPRAMQEQLDLERAMKLSLEEARTQGLAVDEVPAVIPPPASSAPPWSDAEMAGSPPVTLAPDGVEIVQPMHVAAPATAQSADQPAEGHSGGECVVCFDGPQSAVCVPCGHNAVCMDCATRIIETERLCPVCRTEVREIIKLFRFECPGSPCPMASTVLEQLRSAQEDIESYERAVVSMLQEKPRNHRERVLHGHKVSNLLDKVVTQSAHVKELYEDKDNTFEDEKDGMRGRAVFTSFYEQLKGIRSFHRKYPHSTVTHEPNLEEALNPQVPFSGEERFGKYVDLNEFFVRFLNMPAFKHEIIKHPSRRASSSSSRASRRKEAAARAAIDVGPQIDYLTYLTCFHEFSAIPAVEKTRSSEYAAYLLDLKTYLLGFYRRTQPLVDLDDVIAETTAKFEKNWALHTVKGWEKGSHSANEAENEDSNGTSNEQQKDWFCVHCDRQFASEGVYNGHLNGKKHKKAAAEANGTAANAQSNGSATTANGSSNGTQKDSNETARKALAFDEVIIRRLQELLTEVVHGTISYLELKQTRTHEELQAEIAEEEQGAFSDVDVEGAELDDDEEQPFYNPLNLPLGWDGKPIPYWLYKLHGLGVEYKCEICGNHSYWGRRAFDRHFQEWRHAFGMRCLKIPNTKHFHDITLMQDAIALYEKLKDQIDAESWQAADEEEYEDSEGNVLNRKTYEDLARQGLL
ncbi:TPA: hypothetical protein N0F65_010560 [Lagenidium giganteum]|uniref:Uncharacterized protein n=1 Tax=Lagenidium giganteum TaxID=4803 RepID=A0AAV2YKG6_9STRA|nr:TPA: hypothetical protein N0F65_010560 [Lagenidium giganteum]